VQRDLLPLLEGTKINVPKFGDVDTSKILFICGGAFLLSAPSQLLAEIQGRLPIRVRLDSLSEEEYFRILTEPQVHIVKQQQALLLTEAIDLRFTEGALREIAKYALEINATSENLGARRLITVLEKVIEPYSFYPAKYKDQLVVIDEENVHVALEALGKPQLARGQCIL
jgi:ATP-dependent HslUV protease ATP-binding subunit HslU